MEPESELKNRLLARKQALFNRLLSGLLARRATKARPRLALLRRYALKIELDLAALERRESGTV
jgi:hypothetical protein